MQLESVDANQDRKGVLQISQQFAFQITQSLARRIFSDTATAKRSASGVSISFLISTPLLRGSSLDPAIHRLIAVIVSLFDRRIHFDKADEFHGQYKNATSDSSDNIAGRGHIVSRPLASRCCSQYLAEQLQWNGWMAPRYFPNPECVPRPVRRGRSWPSIVSPSRDRADVIPTAIST